MTRNLLNHVPAGAWTFSRGSEPVREMIFSERLSISVSLLQLDKDPYARETEGEEPWDTYDQFVGGN